MCVFTSKYRKWCITSLDHWEISLRGDLLPCFYSILGNLPSFWDGVLYGSLNHGVLYALRDVAVIYSWSKKKHTLLWQHSRYKYNYFTTIVVFFITHSRPQTAFHTPPESSQSLPPDGLPICLLNPYFPTESIGWLDSFARCGTAECPLHLHVLVLLVYGPKPGHCTYWALLQT